MPNEIKTPLRLGPYKFNIVDTLGTLELSPRSLEDDGNLFVETACDGIQDYVITPLCPSVVQTKPVPTRGIRGISDPVLAKGAYLALSCSQAGMTQAELDQRTRDAWDRDWPLFISNRILDALTADPDLVSLPLTDYLCVLAQIQDNFANLNRQVLLLASPSVVSRWMETHAVFQVGDHLETALGNTVVVFPTDRIGGDWVYGLDSWIDIYVSVQALDDAALRALRENNTLLSILEAQYLVVWDDCHLERWAADTGCP